MPDVIFFEDLSMEEVFAAIREGRAELEDFEGWINQQIQDAIDDQ